MPLATTRPTAASESSLRHSSTSSGSQPGVVNPVASWTQAASMAWPYLRNHLALVPFGVVDKGAAALRPQLLGEPGVVAVSQRHYGRLSASEPTLPGDHSVEAASQQVRGPAVAGPFPASGSTRSTRPAWARRPCRGGVRPRRPRPRASRGWALGPRVARGRPSRPLSTEPSGLSSVGGTG